MNRDEWITVRLAALDERMPAPYRGLSLTDEAVQAWCQSVAAGTGRALVLAGPKGTGKTATAWLAYRRLISLGWTGTYKAVTEVNYLESCLHDGIAASGAKAAALLLHDDIGGQAVSDWSRSRLLSLLDTRWLASVPTIVTTNLIEHELEMHLGDRATSRLAHRATFVTLAGVDRRLA